MRAWNEFRGWLLSDEPSRRFLPIGLGVAALFALLDGVAPTETVPRAICFFLGCLLLTDLVRSPRSTASTRIPPLVLLSWLDPWQALLPAAGIVTSLLHTGNPRRRALRGALCAAVACVCSVASLAPGSGALNDTVSPFDPWLPIFPAAYLADSLPVEGLGDLSATLGATGCNQAARAQDPFTDRLWYAEFLALVESRGRKTLAEKSSAGRMAGALQASARWMAGHPLEMIQFTKRNFFAFMNEIDNLLIVLLALSASILALDRASAGGTRILAGGVFYLGAHLFAAFFGVAAAELRASLALMLLPLLAVGFLEACNALFRRKDGPRQGHDPAVSPTAVLLALAMGCLVFYGFETPGYKNDSAGYIHSHYARPPAYPLLLRTTRSLLPDAWPNATVFLQCATGVFSALLFVREITVLFGLGAWMRPLLFLPCAIGLFRHSSFILPETFSIAYYLLLFTLLSAALRTGQSLPARALSFLAPFTLFLKPQFAFLTPLAALLLAIQYFRSGNVRTRWIPPLLFVAATLISGGFTRAYNLANFGLFAKVPLGGSVVVLAPLFSNAEAATRQHSAGADSRFARLTGDAVDRRLTWAAGSEDHPGVPTDVYYRACFSRLWETVLENYYPNLGIDLTTATPEQRKNSLAEAGEADRALYPASLALVLRDPLRYADMLRRKFFGDLGGVLHPALLLLALIGTAGNMRQAGRRTPPFVASVLAAHCLNLFLILVLVNREYRYFLISMVPLSCVFLLLVLVCVQRRIARERTAPDAHLES